MKTSEAIHELATALAKAQSEFPPIPKDKIVKVTMKDGRTYEYAYADLATIVRLTTPALTKHGIAVSQVAETNEKNAQITTKLVHTSGQWYETAFEFNESDKMQETGSSITYIRRYVLTGILGIATEEDDDAQSAAPVKKPPVKPPAKPVVPPKPMKAAHAHQLPDPPKELTRSKILEILGSTYTILDQQRKDFDMASVMYERYGVKTSKDLTDAEAYDLMKWLDGELKVAT